MTGRALFSIIVLTVLGSGSVSGEWRVLGGPEREEGDPVRIVDASDGDLTLSVDGRRGTVIRQISPTAIPAKLVFRFQSTFDPEASEPPTELFGTGDFRIFVGTKGKEFNGDGPGETSLTAFEGFQFRVFPHLKESPIRKKTGDESHTATSIWIRYVEPERRTNSKGDPHSGLMSDACQRRYKENGIHNCGWCRVSLGTGGFGLDNGKPTEMSIQISREVVSIEAGGKRYSHRLEEDERRIDRLDTIAIGHTNISRGYKTLKISDLKIVPIADTDHNGHEKQSGSLRGTTGLIDPLASLMMIPESR
jgi:hypothetical protein